MTITRLVSLGNVVVDVVMNIDALPERGGDVLASAAQLAPGGAFNVMVAAARQGLPTVYGGMHGTGPFGDLAREALLREGIGIAAPRVPDEDTGFDVAMVDSTGERTFVTAVGAEARLTSEHLGALQFRAGDAIHVSGYGMLHPVNRAAIVARLPQLEGVVLFDPGPLGHEIPKRELNAVLSRIDWWSGNAREAARAAGVDDPEDAAVAIASRSACGAVVRLGSGGCFLVEPGGATHRLSGYPVDAIDTNGAGDAHVGAFIAALATGVPPVEAADRANAVAAIAVTRPGPSAAPTREETDAFLR